MTTKINTNTKEKDVASEDLLVPAEDQIDSNNVICPYCQHECYQPEGEDYSEDEREEECPSCAKKFYSSQSFSVDHHTRGDCALNDEDHDYRDHHLRSGKVVPFCEKCGEIQPLNERANAKTQATPHAP
jgi:hypothetical protein